jgi:sugar phosphate isomerase/epimerase
MNRLAFSTNAYKKNSLEEAISSIAQIGYLGVEVMADVPHAYPAKMTASGRGEVRRQIEKPGMKASNVNAFTLFACGDTYHPTWIEEDASQRQIRIDHTIGAIELAAAIGAGTVSLQPGGPMIGTALTRAQAGERFAEALSQVLPFARRHNVVLGVEPEPGLFIESAAEYLEFKNRFFRNDDFLKMNCDVGHLFCVGDDPPAVIRSLAEHVAHVHVEDIGANRVHQHLTPGRGVIDFPAIFAALDDVEYRGWVTVELYPYETTAAGVAKRAFEHLRPMICD